MTIPTLPILEHAQIALDLLDEAEQEFATGKMLKGAEMVWGAAAHGLIAVALSQRRPYNSHGAMKDAARRLLNVAGQSEWLTEFDAIEECHAHFYHGHLTHQELTDLLPRTRLFVNRLLAVAEPADA